VVQTGKEKTRWRSVQSRVVFVANFSVTIPVVQIFFFQFFHFKTEKCFRGSNTSLFISLEKNFLQSHVLTRTHFVISRNTACNMQTVLQPISEFGSAACQYQTLW